MDRHKQASNGQMWGQKAEVFTVVLQPLAGMAHQDLVNKSLHKLIFSARATSGRPRKAAQTILRQAAMIF